jgi:hypothetical protein
MNHGVAPMTAVVSYVTFVLVVRRVTVPSGWFCAARIMVDRTGGGTSANTTVSVSSAAGADNAPGQRQKQ